MRESSHKEKPLSMFTLNLKVQPMKEINHNDTDNTMQKPSLFMAEYKSGPRKKGLVHYQKKILDLLSRRQSSKFTMSMVRLNKLSLTYVSRNMMRWQHDPKTIQPQMGLVHYQKRAL
jgi:hypothetical protein